MDTRAGRAGHPDDAAVAPAENRPAHSVRPLPRPSRIAAGVGVMAALVAVALGTVALLRWPAPDRPGEPVLQPITVSSVSAAQIPLSAAELFALLDDRPDFGVLSDPQRRASCLTGLGYSAATPILGARPITVGDVSGVLLVLAGESPDSVVALAVAAHCSSADTGLFADTSVRRP